MKLVFLIAGIIWGQKEITWDDFKIVPANYAASSATEMNLDYKEKNGKYYFTVTAIFHPEASYVSNSSTRSTATLEHERIHFDITELHCRSLRKIISQYRDRSFTPTQFNEIIRAYNAELDALDIEQRRYDYETEHSLNEYMQNQWEADVKNRLRRK